MIFTKKNNSAIIPTPSTNCFEKRCINLHVNKNIDLYPYKVIEIDLDIIANIPEGHILQIINHYNYHPWQVISSVIHQKDDEEEKEIRLLITSSSICQLKAGDIVCHAQIQSVEDVFHFLKRKYIHNLKFLK
jgi:hypothetical protein